MAGLGIDGPGKVLVFPTSHLDWDWLDTFAEYFAIGPPSVSIPDPGFAGAVNVILTGVCQQLKSNHTFCYSLAEVAYLQAFLEANPDALHALRSAGRDRFELLGGGITSPDNLLCHGEVFIRNYLLGRRWLRSVGLSPHVIQAAWLPDDFGHDPQLPVVLDAMGLHWVGLSRVPGSPQPFPNRPLRRFDKSVADQLNSDGLVFQWNARDGSHVLAHYMPQTYGAVWDGNKAGDLKTFVEKHTTGWPAVGGGPLMFVPAGGDFAFAQWDRPQVQTAGSWQDVLDTYNGDTTKKPADPPAEFGTFRTFMSQATGHAGEPRSPLLAQNYWTGIFASRPQLKMLHYRAAQLAMAAEAASALLRLASTYSTTTLDDLDAAIDQAWRALVPSSHHDYITGTSPDRVFWSEQLPLLQLAAGQADECLTRAVRLIASAVASGTGMGEGTPVVVFNPLGFARGGVASLPAPAVTDSFAGVSTGQATAPVQLAADGELLFQLPADVGSFGYTTVTLVPGDPEKVTLPDPSSIVTLSNGQVTVTLDQARAWAITSFVVNQAQQELLPVSSSPPGVGNSIRLYHDSGNLYQFGNEPLRDAGHPGTFADSGTVMTGGPGKWIEAGPIRWHFRASITGTYTYSSGQPPVSKTQQVSYTLDYLLYAAETVLRMRLTGAAPPAASVLTAFDLHRPSGSAGYGLTHGTAWHWDDHQPIPYWDPPTFRGTHDFVQTTGTAGPHLVIYHQSVPAWSTIMPTREDNGKLLGALLRNTDGTDRGAAGTDPGTHSLDYALGPADASPVATGDALRTALAVTNPLLAAVARTDVPMAGVALPTQASLASITPTAILRVARTQPGSSGVNVTAPPGGYYAERASYILRVYLPAPSQSAVTVTLPSLPNPRISGYDPDLNAVAVTALEEPLADGPELTVSGDTVSFTPALALTTVQLTATRWPTLPDNGH